MNKRFLIEEKKNMNGTFQNEKKAVIDKIENWLVDNIKSELDFTYVSSVRSMIDAIVCGYWQKCYNSETNCEDWKKYGNLVSSDWLEKISNAQNKEDIKLMERVLMTLIITFNSKETKKFREIESKIKELEQESKKDKIDKDRVSQLVNELQPFATSISNKEHGNFPVVSSIFYNQIESSIKTAKWRMNKKDEPKTSDVSSLGKENQTSVNGENDKKRKSGDNELDNESASKKSRGAAGEETNFSNLISEEISQGKEDRDKKITNILAEVKNETDPAKLASSLEQLEKENRGNEIEESKKNEIKQLKEKLLISDPQAKQKLINKLNNLLTKNNLSEEDLDEATRKALKDLHNEENNKEVIKKEESITEQIGVIGAKNKLDKLIARAKNYLKNNLLNKVQEIQTEVTKFIADTGYNYKAYLANKSEVEAIFAQVENLNSERKPQEPSWKKAIVPVSLSVAAVALVAGAVIIIAKKRKRK